jgi:hypothetical protein
VGIYASGKRFECSKEADIRKRVVVAHTLEGLVHD